MKTRKIIALIILFLLLYAHGLSSYAHSGRTDSNGGHYDRSTGEYHYHNDGSSSNTITGILTDNSDETSSFAEYHEKRQEERIEALENEVEYKQNTIKDLNKKINNLENKNSNLWFFFIFCSIIIACVFYNIGKKRGKN